MVHDDLDSKDTAHQSGRAQESAELRKKAVKLLRRTGATGRRRIELSTAKGPESAQDVKLGLITEASRFFMVG